MLTLYGRLLVSASLLATYYQTQHFSLTFELTALLHIKRLLLVTSHNPSAILIAYLVNYYVTLMISQAVKSCPIAWLRVVNNTAALPH